VQNLVVVLRLVLDVVAQDCRNTPRTVGRHQTLLMVQVSSAKALTRLQITLK
jgi:hypothetical protein